MRKILACTILLFAYSLGFGSTNYHRDQNGYNEQMLKLISQIDTIKIAKNYLILASKFQTVGETNPHDWLPAYYAALCFANASSIENNMTKVDNYLDRADKLVLAAEKLTPRNSEILCLQALISSTRIKVDPKSRGLKYVSLSNELLKQALKIEKNPRAWYLQGRNILGTPEGFGGGKDNAKKYFDQAIALFNVKSDTNSIKPSWGKNETLEIIKYVYQGK